MSNPDTTRIFNYPEVTTPASDAKILLDSQTVGSKCIDANLFHCNLIDKTITQRGTFEASEDDADGFKKVVVDIPYTDVHVASGPIATFEGEDLPLKSLAASIVPVQAGSGDPSPTNVRPISGWSGVNVYDYGKNLLPMTVDIIKQLNGGTSAWTNNARTINTLTVTLLTNDNGELIGIDLDGTPTSRVDLNLPISYMHIFDGQSLIFNGVTRNDQAIRMWIGNQSYTDLAAWYTGDKTYTMSADATRFWLQIYANNTFNHFVVYPMARFASVLDNTFAPYNGTTYTIDLDGTRYGGTLDVVSGVLTVDRVYVEYDGSSDEGWALNPNYSNTFITNRPYNTLTTYGISNMYKKVNNVLTMVNGDFLLGSNINIKDTEHTTVTEFKEFLASNNAQFVLQLATPLTIQLTPTAVKSLDGENNVWASTGDVDVEYQTVWVRPTE